MKKTFNLRKLAFCALSFLGFSSQSFSYDAVALWESRATVQSGVTVNDTVDTTYLNDYVRTTLGYWGITYTGHYIVAWLPCSASTLKGPHQETPYTDPGGTLNGATIWSDATHGYPTKGSSDTTFACQPPSGATPLYRFKKGSPQWDHLLITSPAEATTLESNGYSFDRVEGYVFTSQISGTTALYRLSLGAGIPNHDVEHRYVISTSARQSLLNAGWTDEGTIGYVFATPPTSPLQAVGWQGVFNSDVVAAQGTPINVPILNVLPTTTKYPLYGTEYASNSTSRPVGAVWQRITFTLFTGDIFTTSLNNFTHLPVYLHYLDQPAKNMVFGVPGYDGLALVISSTNDRIDAANNSFCAPSDNSTGQLYFELGNVRAFVPDGGIFICDPKLATNLQNNSTYTFTFNLDDSANVKLAATLDSSNGQPISQLSFAQSGTANFSESLAGQFNCAMAPGFGTLSPNKEYCLNTESPDHFPVSNTGYGLQAVWANFPNNIDNSAQIFNVVVNWTDANGNILN